MKKAALRFSILVFFVAIAIGCTRDDICDANTPTTPLLIITFKDFTNPLISKPVRGLIVETIGPNGVTIINRVTTDSIAIPLKSSENNTKYRFTRSETAPNAGNPNNDIVSFTYETEDVYVNRACSFKTIFKNLSNTIDAEGNGSWIRDLNILNTRIENDLQTHITIKH